MKQVVKIYHILQAGLKKAENKNINYREGYKDALRDMLLTDVEINRGNIDYHKFGGVVRNNFKKS